MRWFSVGPTLSLKGRRFKGLRGWAGKPTHPPLTDIPVAAYVIAPAFDLLSVIKGEGETGRYLFVAATYLFIAGAVVAGPTALTGFWDWWKSTPKGTQAWRTANTHMAIMLVVSALVAVNIITRLSVFEETLATSVPRMILSLAIGSLVALGAAYGGALVYDYEFNVEQDKGYAWEEREEDVYPHQEPPKGGSHA
ncbi:MAG: DUF2231 domain-containing protein [Actinomycetota bacterium]